MLICKTNRKSKLMSVLLFWLTDRSFVRFFEEISSLGFVIFRIHYGSEVFAHPAIQNLKILTGFFAIYSQVLVRDLLLFELGKFWLSFYFDLKVICYVKLLCLMVIKNFIEFGYA